MKNKWQIIIVLYGAYLQQMSQFQHHQYLGLTLLAYRHHFMYHIRLKTLFSSHPKDVYNIFSIG